MTDSVEPARRTWLWVGVAVCLAVTVAAVVVPLVVGDEAEPRGDRSDQPQCLKGSAPPPAPWMGESTSRDVMVPAVDGDDDYDATVVAPDPTAYPGSRPVLLFQHGLGGNKCSLLWLARAAAGQGFLGVVWTSPKLGGPQDSYDAAVLATRSAFQYLSDPEFPFAEVLDRDRVGLVGHSLGSIVASSLQGDPEATPGLRAIVALDNLRRWEVGDPGGAVFECALERAGEVVPRVPALGVAMDEPVRRGRATTASTSSSQDSSGGGSTTSRPWRWCCGGSITPSWLLRAMTRRSS